MLAQIYLEDAADTKVPSNPSQLLFFFSTKVASNYIYNIGWTAYLYSLSQYSYQFEFKSENVRFRWTSLSYFAKVATAYAFTDLIGYSMKGFEPLGE